MKIYLYLPVLLLAAACSGRTGNQGRVAGELPNVILILTDDVGYGDSRVYNPDSRIPMPNLEKLADRGMVFTDAHSPAALCAPTRYSMLTGNYPWRGRRPRGTWGYDDQSQILDGQETLGDLMKRAGYHTAMYGKYHMGGHFYLKDGPEEFSFGEKDFTKLDFSRKFRMGPTDLGFDYSFMLLSGIQAHPYAYFENDLLVGDPADLDTFSVKFNTARPGMPYWNADTVGPVMTGRVLDFLEGHFASNESAGADSPFFIYYCSQCIHTPISPAKEIMGTPVEGETFHRVGDFLYEMDVTLGKIMNDLERRGELDNTLIIFTSDNGAWPHLSLYGNGHDPNAPLAGWKGTVWEGGHRVPFVAAWGDGTPEGSLIPPGTRNAQLIGGQDVYATLAELTGQQIADDQALDSRSFLGGLLGSTQEGARGDSKDGTQEDSGEGSRRWLMLQGNWLPYNRAELLMEGKSQQGGFPARLLRDREWKLIVSWPEAGKNNGEAPGNEAEPLGLFNLDEDPREQHNLVEDPGQQDRIRSMMEKYAEISASARSTKAR